MALLSLVPPARAREDVRQDARIARALDAMKADPTRRWTVAALARIAGMSRAAFARRFKHAVGTSPLRWLSEHRLRLAEAYLVDTDLALAAIAAEVGYLCEFAFAKAFKRIIGVAPGLFRRRARTQQLPTGLALFRAAA